MTKLLRDYAFYLAWITATASVIGSLYFSEIAKYTPCNLCWWQRVMMYPLVVILTVGILTKDKLTPYFVLPLSFLGLLIATYQVLLTQGVIPEVVTTCNLGVSCTTRYINWFGFVTIPLLSLLAFAAISGLMIYFVKGNHVKRS